VDKVDPEIGEDEEEGELEPVVPETWSICCDIVELGIAANVQGEADCSE